MKRLAVIALILVAVTAGLVPARAAAKPAIYLVGGASTSINPTPAMLKNKDFYLGGYGISDAKVANMISLPQPIVDVIGQRYATGILGDGVHTRAIAISDRHRTIELAQIEVQGYFAEYQQGPFGITQIRKDAAATIAKLNAKHRGAGPAPTATEIVVDSDHSHGGPDTVGLWGGVPTSYLKLVHDQTVWALVVAWQRLHAATLSFGVAHAGVENQKQYPSSDRLLTNQYSSDPRNQVMDDEVRVLQARDPSTHKVLDTYVNYSAHPDVLGDDNRRVTGDYVGRLNLKISQTFGGFAMDQVATLGREQPGRAGCPSIKGTDKDAAYALCALDGYASRVLTKVKTAAASARVITGTPRVDMHSYFMTDMATAVELGAAVYAGGLVGAPVGRSGNPPWITGNVLGTTYFVGRIGDVLITGGPGEMYAQIPFEVRRLVKGMRGYINVGTAGDFLGYLIAPLGAYPEPIRRTFLSGQPPPVGDPACTAGGVSIGCPDPVGNDNWLLNVSPTIGQRLACAFLRGAGDVLKGSSTTYWSADNTCALFASDLSLPEGLDVMFPSQPDLSAVRTHI